MTPEFWVTTLVVVATPGTGALFTVAAGLAHGPRASVVAAFACTLGILPHLVAALTGLAALLHSSAVLFDLVRWLGIAYLIYLAWLTWRDGSALEVRAERPPSSWRVIRMGILVNLLNPKLTIFFFAFLPQFVHQGVPGALATMLQLSAVFMVVTFVVFVVYGVSAAAVRSHVIGRPTVVAWLRRTFAATYVALAARLAVAER